MANTFTITSIVDNTSDAGFRTWVAEIVSAMFTSIGLTQTADTGQINTSTVTRPAINTSAGYVIGRFNDTAQATSPVFFKLEFGSANPANNPQMWITVGTGSNGSGTITGVTMVRSSVTNSVAPTSIITSYISRFVYNPTYGFFGFTWKIGSTTTNVGLGGLILARSTGATGAVTTDAVLLITNSATTSGNQGSLGTIQSYSYLTSALVSLTSQTAWGLFPFVLLSSVVGGQIQIGPAFQATPVIGVHACIGMAIITEIPVGNTVSLALVGSTAITLINMGTMFGGTSNVGANPLGGIGVMCLWQ